MENEKQLKGFDTYSDSELLLLMSYQEEDEVEAKLAFDEFRRRYNDILWRACYKVCSYYSQSEELQDIVFNNTLLSIYKSNSYDETKGNILLWIFGIAKNELWLALAEINSTEKPLSEDESYKLELLTDYKSDEQFEDRFELKLLSNAINTLPEREQEILLTYHQYSDGNKHLPDIVLERLKEKYQTTSPNIRKIKQRATEKVIAYMQKEMDLVIEKK